MSVMNVTLSNFDEVKNSEKTVLLDFYAVWCGPCQMVSPLVDSIAEENPQYLVGKINVDEEQQLAQMFDVENIPTLIVMKNGKVVHRAVGSRPKAQILAMLES
ncbi:MAG: thioredoxin [Oscillospiraceae bacterium]